MLIKTNYPYLKRETVPVDDVEAGLNENPHRRAEALTGKVQTIDGPLRPYPRRNEKRTRRSD